MIGIHSDKSRYDGQVWAKNASRKCCTKEKLSNIARTEQHVTALPTPVYNTTSTTTKLLKVRSGPAKMDKLGSRQYVRAHDVPDALAIRID